MNPPVTLPALHNELVLLVVLGADWAGSQAAAGSALRVIILPLTPQPWGRGPTMRTGDTPFALPASFGDGLQGGVQAVGVVADVTIITQEQPSWVCGFPTSFTHCALQAAPAFTENHLGDLNTDTVGMVTLATLGTSKQPSLWTSSKTSAHHTHILFHSESVAA